MGKVIHVYLIHTLHTVHAFSQVQCSASVNRAERVQSMIFLSLPQNYGKGVVVTNCKHHFEAFKMKVAYQYLVRYLLNLV